MLPWSFSMDAVIPKCSVAFSAYSLILVAPHRSVDWWLIQCPLRAIVLLRSIKIHHTFSIYRIVGSAESLLLQVVNFRDLSLYVWCETLWFCVASQIPCWFPWIAHHFLTKRGPGITIPLFIGAFSLAWNFLVLVNFQFTELVPAIAMRVALPEEF